MSIEEVKITLLHCGKTNRCEGCPCHGEGMQCIHKALLDALDAILELEKKVNRLSEVNGHEADRC